MSKDHRIVTAISSVLFRIRPAFLGSFLKKMLCIRRFDFESTEGVFFVDPATNFGFRVIQDNCYEPETTKRVHQILRKGDTFVDLGANEGYFSVIGGRIVGDNGRIVAIEPQERLQSVLKKNFELNDLSQITIMPFAVSDKEESAEIHLMPDLNTSASSLIQVTRYSNKTQTIQTKTLRQILSDAGVSKARLIKIDIEGWEWEAIMGSQSVFNSGSIQHILMERHGHILEKRGLSFEEIEDFLVESGYSKNPDCSEHWIHRGAER